MAGRSNRFAAAFSVAALWGVGIAAAAEPGPLAEGWLESIVNERGQHCDKQAEHPDVDRLLIACGAAGVWEVRFDASGPRFARSYEFRGSASGFFVEPGGRIWVKLQVEQAQPLDSAGRPDAAPPQAPPAPTAMLPVAPPPPQAAQPQAAQAERRRGRVVAEGPGHVVIDLGEVDGIERSDRIELSLQHREAWAPGDDVSAKEALAVGVVINVSEHHAKVRIGVNEQVPIGAIAIPTRLPSTASLSGPPRIGGVWEVAFLARPFAAIGELGGGLLLSGTFSRRFETNIRLGVIVDPLGIADVENQDSVGAANAAAFASYDSQYLEMGIGFGFQTVNDPQFPLDPGSGLTLAQIIRLGAEDGLNLSARTSIVLFHQEFDFGGMVAQTQIPVTRGYWLLLGGGGGPVGYGYGEIGLRVLLKGNGGAGSTFLTTTAGGAAVFRSQACTETQFTFDCTNSASFGGPMAGLGGEWRF